MKVTYIRPSSFCMWVERAIKLLNKIVQEHSDKPIFAIHELVHNPFVKADFEAKGVKFVENLDEVPSDDVVVAFSAHWIDKFVLEQAQKRFWKVYNLECPLVTKVYREVKSFWQKGIKKLIYIGKKGHQEAKNVISYARKLGFDVFLLEIGMAIELIPFGQNENIAVVSQTTLNHKEVGELISRLKKEFKHLKLPPVEDICHATFERQQAVIKMLPYIDWLVVVWGKNSSNTKQLYLLGKKASIDSRHVESLEELKDLWIDWSKYNHIGVTGWASTPKEFIEGVVEWLESF